MGKSFAILAIGLLFMLLGCQSMFNRSVDETTHEHLYQGETITLFCRDGEPVQETGIEEWSARATCRDEYDEQRKSQNNATRLFIVAGILAATYGIVQIRKLRT